MPDTFIKPDQDALKAIGIFRDLLVAYMEQCPKPQDLDERLVDYDRHVEEANTGTVLNRTERRAAKARLARKLPTARRLARACHQQMVDTLAVYMGEQPCDDPGQRLAIRRIAAAQQERTARFGAKPDNFTAIDHVLAAHGLIYSIQNDLHLETTGKPLLEVSVDGQTSFAYSVNHTTESRGLGLMAVVVAENCDRAIAIIKGEPYEPDSAITGMLVLPPSVGRFLEARVEAASAVSIPPKYN